VGPHPAVAAVRHAVRVSLADLEPGDKVLAACSGGADSLALAAALAFVAPRAGLMAGGITIDHGLQAGSAAQARRVTEIMAALGLSPALSVAVTVQSPGGYGGASAPAAPAGGAGGSSPPVAPAGGYGGSSPRVAPAGGYGGSSPRVAPAGGYGGSSPRVAAAPGHEASPYPGPEAAARNARYAALDQAAQSTGTARILLGHTLDDQAESVLLGLARGSGARSLAGMAPTSGRYLRPLLDIRRDQTRAACTALGLEPWDDPQNHDPALTRARVRSQLMPALEEALGPGVAEALARTAGLLRADADLLDGIAAADADRLGGLAAALAKGWSTAELAALPEAIRYRLLRLAALAAGCSPGALSLRHVTSMDGLVTSWHGQRWADLPGGVRCGRRYGRLLFTTTGMTGIVPAAGAPGVPAVVARTDTAGDFGSRRPD
jgi:tRNA(Ile)-lysidine synthase